MKLHILTLVGFALTIIGAFASDFNYTLDDEFINTINRMQNRWTAGRNFPKNSTMESLRRLCGVKIDPSGYKLPVRPRNELPSAPIPDHYDVREAYPNCPSTKAIRDQGPCGSCWAFGAVESMTDRICIHSNNSLQFQLSAEDPLSCCKFCGDGCNGGYPNKAWKYWVEIGIVSGGPYDSHQGCYPYEFPPEKMENSWWAPACKNKCEPSYNKTWKEDKYFGLTAYSIEQNIEEIQQEIYKNGPVQAIMKVYLDLMGYQGGVYSHEWGPYFGLHSVKILGWGIEDGSDYWIVANSWGRDWGANGFFKILRGVNECDIESSIVAGLPREN